MTLQLLRLYEIEDYPEDYDPDDHDPDDDVDLVTRTEPRHIGEFETEESLRDRVEQEATIISVDTPPPNVTPLNRFAIYESAGDTDGDGFPDRFEFTDVLVASTPEPTTPSVRKGKRAK